MKQKNIVNKDYHNKIKYVIWILCILLFSVVMVSAAPRITNSGVLLPEVNGSINTTGIFFGTEKITKGYDVVVCRGTSTADDIYKLATCDVVCLSTDSDCGDNINNVLLNHNSVLLRGFFNIITPINISSNKILSGEGMFTTTLNYSWTSDSVIRNKNEYTTGDQNITITNLGINGNAQINTDTNFGYGIRFHGVNNFILDHLYITNTRADFINIGGASANHDNSILTGNGHITNNIMFNSSREGIALESGSNIIINNNNINYVNLRAIDLENFVDNSTSENILISDNIFTNLAGGGIVVTTVNGNKTLNKVNINNNIISTSIPKFGYWETDPIGIYVIKTGSGIIKNIFIDHNYIDNMYSYNASRFGDGIKINSPDDLVSVTNNHIKYIQRYGIYSLSQSYLFHNDLININNHSIYSVANNVDVRYNYILNTSENGVNFISCSYCSIEDNTIINASKRGILVTTSSDNTTIKGNTVYGGGDVGSIAGIGVFSYNEMEGNTVYDYQTPFQVDLDNVYWDQGIYSSLPSCSNFSTFNRKSVFTSSSSICKCYNDNWLCSNNSFNPYIEGLNVGLILNASDDQSHSYKVQAIGSRNGTFEIVHLSDLKLPFVIDNSSNVYIGSKSVALPIIAPLYIQNNGNISIFDSLFVNKTLNASYFVGDASFLNNVPTYNSSYNSKCDYSFLSNNFNGSGNFTTSGWLGIGVNPPTSPLDIVVSNDGLKLRDVSNTSYGWKLSSISARKEFEIVHLSDNKLPFAIDWTGKIFLGSAATGLPLNAPLVIDFRNITINNTLIIANNNSAITCIPGAIIYDGTKHLGCNSTSNWNALY